MIALLVRRDLKSRYVGTFAGSLWGIVNPLATIFVYWIVFAKGLKVAPAEGVPFILVFLGGLVPWLALSETLTTSVGVLVANQHLVKKLVFPTEILPVTQLVASFVTHAILVVLMFCVMAWYGVTPGPRALLLFYYAFALAVFTMGLAWLLSAINVFFRDVGQVVGMMLNIWFWMTPIVWPRSMVPADWAWLLSLNPMYYVTEGYKDVLLFGLLSPTGGILHHVMFWTISLGVFVTGATVFRRLKPEFAEVL